VLDKTFNIHPWTDRMYLGSAAGICTRSKKEA
jgi:hypothetical protein